MEIIKYELKYCERCGTLRLRRVASESTYCRRCEGLLARFAFSRSTGGTNSSALPVLLEPRILAGIPLAVGSERLPGRVQ